MLHELEKIGARKEEDAGDLKGEEKSLSSKEVKLKERWACLVTDMAGGWLGWLLYFGQTKAHG